MLEAVRRALAAEITGVLAEMGASGAAAQLEIPPRRQLGDLAWAGALPLARSLKRPPRAIAEEVVARLQTRLAALGADHPLALLEPGAAVEGPGFVNFRIRRGRFLAHLLGGGSRNAATKPVATSAAPDKIIVEHTNINPNKAAHIGHLRNAVLGDTLVRCLRWLGAPRRGAELRRRHRRPGRRRRGRLPLPAGGGAGGRAGADWPEAAARRRGAPARPRRLRGPRARRHAGLPRARRRRPRRPVLGPLPARHPLVRARRGGRRPSRRGAARGRARLPGRPLARGRGRRCSTAGSPAAAAPPRRRPSPASPPPSPRPTCAAT